MNDLQLFFENNTDNLIHKWMHYFDIYDRYFSRFRGTDVHLLEIGVSHGGSLKMWKEYFGKKATIVGVDINPACKDFEEEQVSVVIGDQRDRSFLGQLKQRVPRVDILIDDGGHMMTQQINTFEILYPHVAPAGIYICEDIHTSYEVEYSGGYRRRNTFIEYSKNLIDYLHAWHSEDPKKLSVSDFTKSTYALHYYDSMLVIEKRNIQKPSNRMTGRPMLSEFHLSKDPFVERLVRFVRRAFFS